MQIYRVSKYSPSYRDVKGHYIREEWTSFSDIGKEYEGIVVSLADYLHVESLYCKAVNSILSDLGIHCLEVKDLEKCFTIDEIKANLSDKGITLSSNEKNLFLSLSNGQIINDYNYMPIIKLLLRECCWCTLYSENINIWTGYDYYLYIECDSIEQVLIDEYNEKGIYIEKYNN